MSNSTTNADLSSPQICKDDGSPSASVSMHDHTYKFSCQSGQCQSRLQYTKDEILELKAKIVDLDLSVTALQKKETLV